MYKFETISIVGLGYIGLPTAAIFASRKIKVIGVDINQDAVDIINSGGIHIEEPELEALVYSAILHGYLRATTTPESADAFLIAVPTPFKNEPGSDGSHVPNLDYIESASNSIAQVLKKGDLVILESTSPVGATDQMAEWLATARPDLSFPQQVGEKSDIRIAYCPERVLPGHAVRELVENDRVIGGMTPKCSELASQLYKTFVMGECVITSARTAEMCKLTENSFRDVNIAFANELSLICDRLGINVWELIKLANRHPRVNVLQPGPGVGGHCIAVDPWFIVHSAPQEAQLIKIAREVNDSKPHYIVKTILEKAKGLDAPVIACLGLSFKPDIDDLRESPAMEIVQMLAKNNVGKLLVVEPYIITLPDSLKSSVDIEFVDCLDAMERANIVVLLVNHSAFGEISKTQLNGKIVIDTRGSFQ